MRAIKYLSTAEKDLNEIVDYMIGELHNITAVGSFLDDIDKKLKIAMEFPYSNKQYISEKKLEYSYRVIPVKNYLVFYVIYDDRIEVHRVIYGARDIAKIMK